MTKHIHYDLILAWANGAEIECRSDGLRWGRCQPTPIWYSDIEYRIKPQPKPNLVREALIVNSLSAGPMLYAASPSEANIVLVFDGETNKLKGCSFKQA